MSASTSERLIPDSTAVCEWSDMTITACSSRNASGPPATCMIRSSARSASAIERTWPSGPDLVRVRVVVGQREQQEVEEVVLDQVGAHAARVPVALAGHPERGRAARVARVEQVRVEQLARAVHRVAELRRLGDPAVDARARRVVPRAAAVDQVGRAGGPQAGVVQVLEDGPVRTREVRQVHVVDRVVERAHDPEGARGGQRRAVLHVALLAAVEPVHRGDVVLARARSRWRSPPTRRA